MWDAAGGFGWAELYLISTSTELGRGETLGYNAVNTLNFERGQMARTPEKLKIVDPHHVQEMLASGPVIAHPYGPGMTLLTFTAARHDPMVIVEQRQGQVPDFVVIARIVVPDHEAMAMVKKIESAVSASRARLAQMPAGSAGPGEGQAH